MHYITARCEVELNAARDAHLLALLRAIIAHEIQLAICAKDQRCKDLPAR